VAPPLRASPSLSRQNDIAAVPLARATRVQAFLAHQMGAHAAELPLAGGGPVQVEHLRHHQIQHRVAEEFEAFVMNAAMAAVRERLLAQLGIGKAVAQRLFEPGDTQLDCPSNFSSR
jgi:hypothetical protein